MDAIALGCLTALATHRAPLSPTTLRTLAGLGAALLILILGFSNQAENWGLGRSGLDMKILAIGTCMIIAAAAQSRWQGPGTALPLIRLGQRSYEVYLTHMFVVFALFNLYREVGAPLAAVPVLFVAVILLSMLLGEVVARVYSDPMNQLLRAWWGWGMGRTRAA